MKIHSTGVLLPEFVSISKLSLNRICIVQKHLLYDQHADNDFPFLFDPKYKSRDCKVVYSGPLCYCSFGLFLFMASVFIVHGHLTANRWGHQSDE